MNYSIEGNLDFKTALLNDDEEENAICLISQQPLTKSHIKLPCNHTFNYKPLFNEIYIQKIVRNMYETTKLKINQLKCPYCRSVSEHLLPYIPSEQQEKNNGVNMPAKYCMANNIECEWHKQGNTKHKPCTASACYIDTVSYCKKHYNKMQTINDPPKPAMLWTPEMTTLAKNKTLIELKKLLRLHKLAVSGNKKTLVERIFANNLTL